jgi:hypothetical protein
MRAVFTAFATELVSCAVVRIVSHVSCNDAIRSAPTAGTYSEYNITAKSFDSDACAASTLSETNRYSSSVCDESQYDDDYYNYGYYSDGKMHSTAFGQSLDRITKDRLRHEKQKQHSRSVVRSSTTAIAGIAGASSSLTRYSKYCMNQAPQGTDGFIYYQYFTSTDCGGSISMVEGYYADYCAPEDSGMFYKYSFNQSDCSDLLLLSYSDDDCLLLTNITNVFTTYQQSQCQNIVDPSYPAMTSFQAVCSAGSVIPIPMDSYVEG